jgi:diguanylate cyclase (GGDEF)-like protein
VTPLSFGFSNLIVAWALFRYRLFDLIPVAYSQVIEQMEDALIVLDPTCRIIDMNPTAQTLLSLPLDAAIGKPFLEFLPAVIEFWDPAKEACQEFELELPEENWFQVRVRPLKRKQQVTNGYIVLMQNITTRKSFEDQLRHLAITDPLTGIFNRRHFFTLASKNLETAIDTARPLAVLLMDIDHFKDTNDTLGHIAGDLLLQHLMERCAENMRPNDILARYGGEEFIVMLPDTSEAAAVQVAERLRNRIEAKPFEVAGANICITVSIGIACYDGRGDVAIDDLVNRADTGLLNAKRSGRNRIDIVSDTIS